MRRLHSPRVTHFLARDALRTPPTKRLCFLPFADRPSLVSRRLWPCAPAAGQSPTAGVFDDEGEDSADTPLDNGRARGAATPA